MSGGGLHGRSTTDDAFYEWLLSDHPDARAERDYRRGAHYQRQQETAADIAAWADRISADPDRHTRAARDLAATIGPRRRRERDTRARSTRPSRTRCSSPGCGRSSRSTAASTGTTRIRPTATPPT